MSSQRFPSLVRNLLLAVCAALLFATGALAQTGPASTVTLRIGASPDDGTTPLLYARSAGLFQRAGLSIDLQKFTSGSAIAAAVAGGSLDIGRANTFSLVTAVSKGIPFVAIAPVESYRSETPTLALLVAASSTLQMPRDFIGKTIAVSSLGDLYSIAIRTWLDKNGVDPASVHLVELPQTALLAALDQGRIDGAGATEPLIQSALSTHRYRILGKVFDAIAPRFLIACFFANTAWVDSHRDLVERFIRVVRAADVYLSAHENESPALLAPFMQIDPATLAGIPHPFRPAYLEPSDLQPVIDVLAGNQLIPKTFPARSMISPLALER